MKLANRRHLLMISFMHALNDIWSKLYIHEWCRHPRCKQPCRQSLSRFSSRWRSLALKEGHRLRYHARDHSCQVYVLIELSAMYGNISKPGPSTINRWTLPRKRHRSVSSVATMHVINAWKCHEIFAQVVIIKKLFLFWSVLAPGHPLDILHLRF